VERLERGGYITGYRALLNPAKLGFSILSLVLISVKRTAPSGGKSAQVLLAERIIKDCDEERNLPWVEEAYIITGHYDIILKIWARDLKQLSHFLINYLPTHQEIAQTETMLVLETVADNRTRTIPMDKAG
jgi:Lrp/AsnC family transcriptional regulator for asnA, asnC and gidA